MRKQAPPEAVNPVLRDFFAEVKRWSDWLDEREDQRQAEAKRKGVQS